MKTCILHCCGDCTSSQNEKEEIDSEIIETGIEEINKLNEKYKEFGNQNPKFYFLYRKRIWNPSEKCYLGWERKRGLLCEFNLFLLKGINNFRVNTLENDLKIKYIITLDSDTNLCLDTASKLIGAMAHVLNKPKLNEKNIVVEGHALIQPRVGIELEASRKSLFTNIFYGNGGTDLYANAISDVYQDNFGEGIFTGKGIYDLEIFHQVLNEEIPENTVLSHDLLEGSYLRCGLASDIVLMDGCPNKYSSYITRLHRWIRGDWQIYLWLKNTIKIKNGTYKINPLNLLSKFKILDNLRRSLIPIFSFILMLLGAIIKIYSIFIIGIIALVMPTILDLINYIVFRKNIENSSISAHRNITKVMSELKASALRALLNLSFLPNTAYKSADAIIRSLYRITVSKENLLEWITSEEAEKQAKNDLSSYNKSMSINVFVAILGFIISIITRNIILLITSVIWAIGPEIAYIVSKENKKHSMYDEINKENKNYLLEIGKKTWSFFENHINEKNNFLPPDNYQEDRKEKIAPRTSPTNIGLGLLTIVSAYDLKYINLDKCVELIEKMLYTIEKMQKWNGHLYNWYNTVTLEPLYPRYVSTVDSGNFIGYLYTLKQFLVKIGNKEKLIQIIDNLIKNTDFSVLYDYKHSLFSIGFNIEENKLTDSYYDLLASEARQASLVAIAKRDIPSKHWNTLSRTLTSLNKYKGLVSWSGTAFEYLMPNINIKKYEGSLLDESCRFMVMSQKEYAKKLRIPWGISEAAFNLRDLNNNYQYKAFGIPWLGLKRGLEDDMVVSPYSVFLSLIYTPKEAIENIKLLEKEGMYDKYGFYESIDYTTARLNSKQEKAIVKTYMAHHQGLILLSINNFINNEILVERFSKNPEIQAIDILLQEKMPAKAIITKEKKEKIKRLKIKDYENYIQTEYTKTSLKQANVISNGNYTICTKTNGEGFSKYRNIMINRYKETADYSQGNFYYVKNLNNNKVFNTSLQNDRVIFAPDVNKFIKTEGNIQTTTETTVSPDEPLEIRRLTIKNIGETEENLEVINYFEPVLSTPAQDYAHMAFNNLFLSFEKLEDGEIIVKRKKRGPNEKNLFLGVCLYTETPCIGNVEYEIDKEKFIGKGNLEIPEMVRESKPYSNSTDLVTESILAIKKTIKIPAKEKIIIDLIMGISDTKEKALELVKSYENTNIITKTFKLARAKTETETIYLGLKGKDIAKYQKLLSYLIFKNPLKKLMVKENKNKVFSQSELWKFGISRRLANITGKN